MRFRKFTALLLTICFLLQLNLVLLQTSAETPQMTFYDLDGHWAKESIEYLQQNGIVNGYRENGKVLVKPDLPISRAEAATVFTAGEQLKVENTEPIVFKDVAKDDWFLDAVNKVSANGIMIGNDGYFHPNAKLTRAEAAMIFARITGFRNEAQEKKRVYSDIGSEAWYYDAVLYCTEKGLLTGYPDGSFCPQNDITRAECFTILAKLLKSRKTDEPKQKIFLGGSGGGTTTDIKPVLQSISPASGTFGTIITLTGKHLSIDDVKVVFTGELHKTIEIEPLTVNDTTITVLAPVSLLETVQVSVTGSGESTGSKSFVVEPMPAPTGNETAEFSTALNDIFANLSSELGNAFASLPQSDLDEKQSQVAQLQEAVQEELDNFFGNLTEGEEYLLNQALSSEGVKEALDELNEASEILSHSSTYEALENIAKAKEKIDNVIEILTEVRAVLRIVKIALYAAAAVAAAAAVFSFGASSGTALELYHMADRVSDLISYIISPVIAALKSVSAILSIAPTVAVQDSFTTYDYEGDIQINQYFGSLESQEISPITSLLMPATVLQSIELYLTSVAEDDVLSVNEQLIEVTNEIKGATLSGSPASEETYDFYWRVSLWQELIQYVKNSTGEWPANGVSPSENIGLESFMKNYYPTIYNAIPGDFEDWLMRRYMYSIKEPKTEALLNAWTTFKKYYDPTIPLPLPAPLTLTSEELTASAKAAQIVALCTATEGKPVEEQAQSIRQALPIAESLAGAFDDLEDRIKTMQGGVKSALVKANRSFEFYKSEQHSLNDPYSLAFKKMTSDLKALSSELDVYILQLDRVQSSLHTNVARLKGYSNAVLKEKLISGSVDNSTLVVFINEPYSFRAHMDFVPPDDENLEDLLNDIWSELLHSFAEDAFGALDFDPSTMINGVIVDCIVDLIADASANPFATVIDEFSNLKDVDVDIVMEVEDPTILAQPESAKGRMTVKGLKPGTTKVKIYPDNIDDPDVIEACTIERTVLVLSGNQPVSADYTMGPRIDSVTDADGNELTNLYIGDEVTFNGFGLSMDPQKHFNQTYTFLPPNGVAGTVENWMTFGNSYTSAGLEIPDTLPTSPTINVGKSTKWPSNTKAAILPPRIDNKTSTAIVGEAWPAVGQGFSHTPSYNKAFFGNTAVDIIPDAADNPTAGPANFEEDFEVNANNHDDYKALHRRLNLLVPDLPKGKSTFQVSLYDGQVKSNEKEIGIKKFGDIGTVSFDWMGAYALKPDFALNPTTGDGLLVFTRGVPAGYDPQVRAVVVHANGTYGANSIISEDVGGLEATPSGAAVGFHNGTYYVTFTNRANDIAITSSTDGIHWNTPYTVDVTPDRVDRFPDIAALDLEGDGVSELAVSYTEEAASETGEPRVKLAYIRKTLGGFTTQRITPYSDGSFDSAVSAHGNNLVLSYISGDRDGKNDASLFYGNARDVLASASGMSVRLSDNPAHTLAANPSAAITTDGTVYAVWENEGESGNEDVFFAKVSADGETLASYNLTKSTRQSQNPQIAIDGRSIPTVIWVETGYAGSSRTTGFQSDLYFTRSFDDGTSFNAPYLKLDSNEDGLRMTAPSLCLTGDAKITAVYQATALSQQDNYLVNRRDVRLVSTECDFGNLIVPLSLGAPIDETTQHILRVYSNSCPSDVTLMNPREFPNGNLYLSDNKGNGLVRLTATDDIRPLTGNSLNSAYIGYTTKNGLYIAEADGTNPVRIATAPDDCDMAGVIWRGDNYLLYLTVSEDDTLFDETTTIVRCDGTEKQGIGTTSTGFSNYTSNGNYIVSDVGNTMHDWTRNGTERLYNCAGIAFGEAGDTHLYQMPGNHTDRWATFSSLRAAYISYISPESSSLEDMPHMVYHYFGNLYYRAAALDPWTPAMLIDSDATMPTVGTYGKLVYIKNKDDRRKLYFSLNALAGFPHALPAVSGADELYPVFSSDETLVISHTKKGSNVQLTIIDPITEELWTIGPDSGFSGIASSFTTGKKPSRDTIPPAFITNQIGVTEKQGDIYTIGFSEALDSNTGLYKYCVSTTNESIEPVETLTPSVTMTIKDDEEVTVRVCAMDYAGNLSEPLIFTFGANDETAPHGVGISLVSVTGDTAVFSVSASDDVQMNHYELYLNGEKKATALSTTSQITVTGLASNTDYTAVLKAYDSRMNAAEAETTFHTKYGYTKVSFVSATGSIRENTSWGVVANLLRTGDTPTEAIGVEITIEDITADHTTDYDPNHMVYSVYLQPDQLSAQLSVDTTGFYNNNIVEPDKTFRMRISFIGTENAVIGEISECIVTIIDDDIGENSVSFDALTTEADEDAGSVSVTVIQTRPDGDYGNFNVHYTTMNGSALAGTHYTAVSGDLVFAAGEMQKTIVIPLIDNADVSGDLDFVIKLSSPTNGVTMGNIDMTHVTIKDNDTAALTAPVISVTDDNTQYPIIVVNGIARGERITLYRKDSNADQFVATGYSQIVGDTSYNITCVATYGSGIYAVTRTVDGVESEFSNSVTITVSTTQISYVPQLSETILIDKGTEAGTIKLIIVDYDPTKYYYYGISDTQSRQGQVQTGSPFGSEMYFAPNQIIDGIADNITATPGHYLNLYVCDTTGPGGIVTGVTTKVIPDLTKK